MSYKQQLAEANSRADQAAGQVTLLRELLSSMIAEKEQRIKELTEENARLKAQTKH